MSKLKIERLGGLAGFGGQNSHLRSIGEIEMDKLSNEEKKAVEDLFTNKVNTDSNSGFDMFRYKISRTTPNGTETIEAGEELVPEKIKQCVRDEFV